MTYSRAVLTVAVIMANDVIVSTTDGRRSARAEIVIKRLHPYTYRSVFAKLEAI